MTMGKTMRFSFVAVLLPASIAGGLPRLGGPRSNARFLPQNPQHHGTPAREDYIGVVSALGPFIQREVSEKELPALSIALIDDQQTVWAEGFGFADAQAKRAATA